MANSAPSGGSTSGGYWIDKESKQLLRHVCDEGVTAYLEIGNAAIVNHYKAQVLARTLSNGFLQRCDALGTTAAVAKTAANDVRFAFDAVHTMNAEQRFRAMSDTLSQARLYNLRRRFALDGSSDRSARASDSSPPMNPQEGSSALSPTATGETGGSMAGAARAGGSSSRTTGDESAEADSAHSEAGVVPLTAPLTLGADAPGAAGDIAATATDITAMPTAETTATDTTAAPAELPNRSADTTASDTTATATGFAATDSAERTADAAAAATCTSVAADHEERSAAATETAATPAGINLAATGAAEQTAETPAAATDTAATPCDTSAADTAGNRPDNAEQAEGKTAATIAADTVPPAADTAAAAGDAAAPEEAAAIAETGPQPSAGGKGKNKRRGRN